jgi:hypothetical protein
MGKSSKGSFGRNRSGTNWSHAAAGKCPPGADKVKQGNSSTSDNGAPKRTFGKKGG